MLIVQSWRKSQTRREAVTESHGSPISEIAGLQRGYIADEQDCQPCPLRPRCLTGRGGKRRYLWVTIGAELTNLSKRMAAKIDTEQGRKIYPQRFAVVEPLFANIRTQKRLDRFTVRGRVKVNIQWLLYCMIHNIEKIKNYGFA